MMGSGGIERVGNNSGMLLLVDIRGWGVSAREYCILVKGTI